MRSGFWLGQSSFFCLVRDRIQGSIEAILGIAVRGMKADTLVIVNPAAGGGRALRSSVAVADYFAEQGRNVEFSESRSSDDLREQAARAAATGFRYVIALGGDGAFHHLVEGLYWHGGNRRNSSGRQWKRHRASAGDSARSGARGGRILALSVRARSTS